MRIKGKRKYSLLLVAVLVFSLVSGCGNKTDEAAGITTENGMSSQTDADAFDETEPVRDNAYEIKNNPVDGNSGLYEVDFGVSEDASGLSETASELSAGALWPVDMVVSGETVYAIYESYEMTATRTYLYALDPLRMRVIARTELTEGMYFEDAITVSDDGEILVYNCGEQEIYVLNDRLEETGKFALDDDTAGVVISEDTKYGYYMDYNSGIVWRIDLNDGSRTCVFEDIPVSDFGYGSVCGVLGNEWLAFSYDDVISGAITYEIRNIESGEIVYQSPDSLYDMQGDKEHFILRHREDGLDEIICNDVTSSPHVLMLRDYGEYENVFVDWGNQAVLSGATERDAMNKQFKLSCGMYNLENGTLQYAFDFYIPYAEGEALSGGDMLSAEGEALPDGDMLFAEGEILSIRDMICLEDTGYILISVSRTKNHLFVWDLHEQSSQTGDAACYFRDWQNPEEPDLDALETLLTRADEIGAKYGVEIYFGDEVENCYRDMYDYEITYNAVRIEQALNMLDKALSLYPDGMLAQLDDDFGSVLKIYLSGKIVAADETALTTAVGIQNTLADDTFMVLDILSIYDYERTIHHELFHAVEGHVNDGEYYFDYDVWMTYNPDGFNYDFSYTENEMNSDWSYVVGGDETEGYFIDLYSKSFPNEDRARIMEYAMMEPELQTGCFESEPLRRKLSYICEQIRAGFDTTGWPEKTIWEQSIYQ